MPQTEEGLVGLLVSELGLTPEEARGYVSILKSGSLRRRKEDNVAASLESKGMIILSGDDKEFIPLHPRLAVSNGFRTWRERMVREINEKRVRVDKLTLQLIPLYEAATEKRLMKR